MTWGVKIGHYWYPPEYQTNPELFELMPVTKETMTSELQPGDVIPWRDRWQRVMKLELLSNGRQIRTTLEEGTDKGTAQIVKDLDTDIRWVRIGRPKASVPAAAKAPTPSQWNGRCRACGKGTYSGFMTVEHEGGPCGLA